MKVSILLQIIDPKCKISSEEKAAVKDILINNMNQKSYRLKNLVVKIISQIVVYDYPKVWDGFLENVCEGLESEDICQVDTSLRILIQSIKHEEKYHSIVNRVLEKCFSAFTNSDSDSKIREK